MRIHRLITPALLSLAFAASAGGANAAKMSARHDLTPPMSVNCPTDASGAVIGRCVPEELPDVRCQAGMHANPSPDPSGYHCVPNGY